CIVLLSNAPATTELSTLSLHDALPIWSEALTIGPRRPGRAHGHRRPVGPCARRSPARTRAARARSRRRRGPRPEGTAGAPTPADRREDTRSPPRARASARPGSGRPAGGPAPRRRRRAGRPPAPARWLPRSGWTWAPWPGGRPPGRG